jgi:hypothetical protein
MAKLVKNKNIRLTEIQYETLKKLEFEYSINVNEFIRIAISEKINRDYKIIKQKKVKCPF